MDVDRVPFGADEALGVARMSRSCRVTLRLFLVACTVAVALPLAGPASAARQFETAVVDQWSELDPTSAFERVRAVGATKVRLPLYWSRVAPPTKPEYPQDPNSYVWTTFDKQLAGALAAGLEPIVSIAQAPTWALNKASWGQRTTTPKIADFRDFAIAAATRYSGYYFLPDAPPRVRYWQAWNEPNISLFLKPQRFGGRWVSPGNYRWMTNAFSRAVKGVKTADGKPNLVVAGGTAPFDGSGPGPLRFMRMMLCLDTHLRPRPRCPASRFDIWSHHPYTQGGPNHHAFSSTSVSLGDLPEMKRVLNAAIKARKIANASRRVRWWVTEFSWDTNPPDPYMIGPRTHARWVAEALYRMWTSGISLVAWFQVEDEPRSTSRYQSGLHYADGRRKRAFYAFRFPFVALTRDGRLTVWGRVPPRSSPSPRYTLGERVAIQRWTGARWVEVRTLRTTGYGIFSARWSTSQRRGYFRAALPNKRVKPSLKFGSARTKDVFLRLGPFGCGGPVAC
jgi:hypothetical protein